MGVVCILVFGGRLEVDTQIPLLFWLKPSHLLKLVPQAVFITATKDCTVVTAFVGASLQGLSFTLREFGLLPWRPRVARGRS